MTKAAIISYARTLVNEISTDAGTLLADAGNVLEILEDAVEQVVLDLAEIYPNELQASELVSMVANDKDYTLTNEYLQILKIEKCVTGENPTEMEIIDPLQRQYIETHGETHARPYGAYVVNGVLFIYPTPSAALTNYVQVWGIKAEATTMVDAGPSAIPRHAHRLICYWMAMLVANILGADEKRFAQLYQYRLQKLLSVQSGKFQQSPRFVKESSVERTTRDTRERAFADRDWP